MAMDGRKSVVVDSAVHVWVPTDGSSDFAFDAKHGAPPIEGHG